ncbi:MAG: glycosyltransferase family 2 protein [Candidatus Bathyarchaeia archaeon]
MRQEVACNLSVGGDLAYSAITQKCIKPRVSIFIPVYKGSNLLDELLSNIINSRYKEKEIFVIIDEPTPQSIKIAEKYENEVVFIINQMRIGKVEALNHAIKKSSGDILLFLDSDIKLEDGNFLEYIVEAMVDADIVDVKKDIIGNSFISKMVSYEFLSCNIVSYLYSKIAGRCMCVNGVAFAIKREAFMKVGGFSKVISEDFDLATKTLLGGKRFKYVEKVKVYTEAPSNWCSWFIQRKRWGIGAGLWFKHYWRNIIEYAVKNPHLAIPSLILLFPAVISYLSAYALACVLRFNLTQQATLIPIAQLTFSSLTPYVYELLFNISLSLFIGLLALTLIFYILARKLNYKFNFIEFIIYLTFYQPISALVLFTGILAALFSNNYKLDWKV